MPAACLPAWRVSPSSFCACVEQLRDRRVALARALSFGSTSSASGIVYISPGVLLRDEARDLLRLDRPGCPWRAPTSLMTLRALSSWNVAICPTTRLAVLVGDVLDDLVAPVHAEVDVEVRHAHALGVQEALEEQVVRDGIEIGDPQRVRDERARARAAARPDRDAVLLGVADEVPDDEEVARELHLAR